MNTQRSIHQYLIRYKDLEGKSHLESVYASDAMEAQNFAIDCNSGLFQRPHLINAVIKTDKKIRVVPVHPGSPESSLNKPGC